jgi:hypothetical protein
VKQIASATPHLPITCRTDFTKTARLILTLIADEIIAGSFSSTRMGISTCKPITAAARQRDSGAKPVRKISVKI